jgi:FAD:protein FMN transferase
MSRLLPAIEGLGTVWQIEVFDEIDDKTAKVAYGDLCGFISVFEAKYSRFKKDSVITQLNETGVMTNPDPETLTLLRLGQKLYGDTDGIFNCLVGGILEARGYDANYSFTATNESIELSNPERDLIITDNQITLLNGKVDLGGFGKGWLIDQVAKRMQIEHGIKYCLVNGGGDIYATSDHGEPIKIYLEHPVETGTYIATTTLKDQGFAASSTHKRRWKSGERELSHIVDTTATEVGQGRACGAPLSDQPHPDHLGIYIKAPSAVIADAWSTTLVISSPDHHQTALTQAGVSFALLNIQDSTLVISPNF